MTRPVATLLAALTLVALLTAACTDAGDLPTSSEPPSTTPNGTDPSDDEFPTADAREQARGVLGMFERDLPDGVRIARRGAETFPNTDDYVLGRLTVELDDENGDYRVAAVTVELPEGPETFNLQGG